MLLQNSETGIIKMYCNKIVSVFKHIYIIYLSKNFGISDDALLVKAKRQNYKEKNKD